MVYRKVSLDEIPQLSNKKHADFLLCNDSVIVVIEESGRPELRDIEKIKETINHVKNGDLDTYMGIIGSKARIIGILHRKKGDPIISKCVISLKRKEDMREISCDKNLEEFLRDLEVKRLPYNF
jgi:hypothetical protein